MTPIFITVRDRVSDLRNLVAWLEKAGHERICLLDNQSTYEPLLTYLSDSPHEVIYLKENFGPRALWEADLVPNERFVVTDPDVLPIDDCPLDAVAYLEELMDRHRVTKAGLGLYLDDVESYPSLAWEHSLVSPEREIAPAVYMSLIDTTFAVYGAGVPWSLDAIRTGHPYRARHLPWYVTEPGPEDRYYLDRAVAGPNGSSWKDGI
jgi:hypothetical protein